MEWTAGPDKKCWYEILPLFHLEGMSTEEYDKLKMGLAKDIQIEYPDVISTTFIGMNDVKEYAWKALISRDMECDKILFFGPPGSGKSHLVRVFATLLNSTLYKIDKINFHGWAKNMELFCKIFAEIANENCSRRNCVILFLNHFDWFYDLNSNADWEPDRQAVIKFLTTIHTSWGNYSRARLIVMACSYQPWFFDRPVIEQFKKRIYLRPLDLEEKRLLIQKKVSECVNRVEMTSAELGSVVTQTDGLAAWEVIAFAKEFIRQKNEGTTEFVWPTVGAITGTKNLVKFEKFNEEYGNGSGDHHSEARF